MSSLKSNLKINNGNMFTDNHQIVVNSINHFCFLLNGFFDGKSYDESKEILKKCFFDDIGILVNIIKKKPSLFFEKKIEYFLSLINQSGFGEFSLNYYNKNKIILESKNAILHKTYNEIFKIDKNQIVNALVVSLFELFFELHLQKKVNSKINLKADKIYFTFEILNEEKKCDIEFKYDILDTDNINNKVRNILLKEGFRYEDGKLLAYNLKIVFIPIKFLFNLIDEFSNNMNVIKFYNKIGYMSGRCFVNTLQNLGSKAGEETFNGVIDIFDTTGFGRFNLINNSKTQIELSNYFLNYIENNFDEKIVMLYYKFISEFYRGIYEGSFDISTKTIVKKNYSFELFKTSKKYELTKFDKFMYKWLLYKNVVDKSN